jgi:penicillin-binding protein 1C
MARMSAGLKAIGTVLGRLRAFVRAHRPRLWTAAAVVLCGVTGLAWWLRCGPLPAGLLDPQDRPSVVITDRFGEPLYEARSGAGARGEWIDATDIPPVVADATMAAEDRRFRHHVGVDPLAIARAAWRDLRARRIVEGGSTITQQVAELLLRRQATGNRLQAPGDGLQAAGSGPQATGSKPQATGDGLQATGTRRRVWRAKVWEAVIALRLEHRLSKDEILALYLNLAPYGNQIDGVQRAARAYLGAPLGKDAPITAAEAAYLAALPQQPSRFNPWRNPDAPRARQQRILQTMAIEGWLSPENYQNASRERVSLRREAGGFVAPHFIERVLSETADMEARRIETTLDRRLQETIHGIIAGHRDDLTAHRAANVAVVVLDNHRGEWLAWEGSGDYFDAEHGGAIDGVRSPRQPGSALKPFTYAAAFERGSHPGTVLADVPSQFPTAEAGILYAPENYDGQFRGPMLARVALAGSENVPAVALAAEVGVPALARLLRQAGLSTLDRNASHYGLGLTLGNAEVRLDELVAAYSTFARGGVRLPPRHVLRIDDRAVPAPAAERLVSERTAFWVTDVLADNDARAFVFGRGGSLEFPFPVAAKTGTSQAYHDNWAIGYTRDVTVGVWVGNFDRTPLQGSSGVTGAGPIFHDVMLAVVERVRGSLPVDEPIDVTLPTPDVRRATLCAVSGMLATDRCVRRVSEWMPREATLSDCSWHHASERGLITAWPQEYEAWARTEGLWREGGDVADLAAVSSRRMAAGRGSMASFRVDGVSIVSPVSGATYLLDPTLRPDFQTLPLRASGARSGAKIEWRLDAKLIGTTAPGETLRWPMTRGRHTIEARDGSETAAETWIEVK